MFTRFDVFGSDIPDQVQALYPLANFSSPQQAYDSISSDVGPVCGNLEVAALASQTMKSPIYAYVCTQKYSQPCCAIQVNGYCPRYSFHMLDIL
jgi:hypothetical protein